MVDWFMAWIAGDNRFKWFNGFDGFKRFNGGGAALLYSYAPHQPPLNPLNLLNPPNLFCPQSKDGTPAWLTPNPEP